MYCESVCFNVSVICVSVNKFMYIFPRLSLSLFIVVSYPVRHSFGALNNKTAPGAQSSGGINKSYVATPFWIV